MDANMDAKDRKIAELEDALKKAYFHLVGWRSPSLTKREQEAELASCHDVLVEHAFGSGVAGD